MLSSAFKYVVPEISFTIVQRDILLTFEIPRPLGDANLTTLSSKNFYLVSLSSA